jgi:hypothetical protein
MIGKIALMLFQIHEPNVRGEDKKFVRIYKFNHTQSNIRSENKIQDLGLPLAIFDQAFLQTS